MNRHLCLPVLWLSLVAAAALAPLLEWHPKSGISTRRFKLSALRNSVPDNFQSDLPTSAISTTTTIGVIGCGTIASAIVTGLAGSDQLIRRITVSRRSEHRSTALQSKFPHLVHVIADDSNNQAVLDASEIIFVTVLPPQAEKVVRELQWDPKRHTLVSLVATANLEDLQSYSQLPASRVYKMICLPAVAYNEGICLLQPAVGAANEPQKQQYGAQLLLQLLEILGGVVVATNGNEMSAMMVPPCMMGSFYGVLRSQRDWLVQTNAGTMTPDQATYVVTRFYYGMMQDAARQCGTTVAGTSDALDRLIAEQTPGGLNEQGLANLEHLGTMDAYNQVQDAIWRRITGQSDGSLL